MAAIDYLPRFVTAFPLPSDESPSTAVEHRAVWKNACSAGESCWYEHARGTMHGSTKSLDEIVLLSASHLRPKEVSIPFQVLNGLRGLRKAHASVGSSPPFPAVLGLGRAQ
jgi:hypothetical protein